jgi:hypothetical protein
MSKVTKVVKTPKPEKFTKKNARTEVYEKLSVLLSDYGKGKNEKKFRRTLKKASKLFAPIVLKSKEPVITVAK